ncbi:RsmB/NOP family class I SAM-dependent RNA methyltransferase [Tropicimonas marinistellae]|uniref:RsmB/NOP family class I SAM-dependent RNA methyltransferase n=1 Tax=Tropicimonas marinistellae TaxID=1739787 RepID=UPI00082D0CBB|nr:RsmB/NOP family class I SAM-dependent RNA methyltransferase [Tropicimonas marinistellae]
MTPEARIAAAAEILDLYLAGEPAERALTRWARRSRFAGSGDRAAIRDHVYDAIRRQRSAAAAGGAETGRGLIIGLLRLQGVDPTTMLTGTGYSLPPLSDAESAHTPELSEAEALDCPEWLEADLRHSLGGDYARVMNVLRERADVFLRVNLARGTLKEAQAALAGDRIVTEPHPLSTTALRVIEGARRVSASEAYRNGLVELQDAASQAVSDRIPLPNSGPVLDYCAGGGGKALALAARFDGEIVAHDAKPARMKDIPARAARAGARVKTISHENIARLAPFDVIVADVPCSGSGAWRRQPEAKWRLDRPALAALLATQAEILSEVARLTADGGAVAYMTCSILQQENTGQIDRFLQKHPLWDVETCEQLSPLSGGDGFFLSVLRRNA